MCWLWLGNTHVLPLIATQPGLQQALQTCMYLAVAAFMVRNLKPWIKHGLAHLQGSGNLVPSG